jgi:NAD(P)-dependent dehydrogenase (short-subunit alcohol dehydrogenase family)
MSADARRTGLRAIVTGAARGIGRAMALRLARDSAQRCGLPASIVIADRHADELEALAAELRDAGAAVRVRAGDLCDPAHPLLARARGCLVLTTSVSGTHATPPLAAYSPSKAAALMLMRQMALERGPDGIRVNAISPGLTVTPGTAPAYANAGAREQREARIPLRRLAEPDDVAAVLSFLVGPDAAYVHGHDLVVDGGLVHTLMPSLTLPAWLPRADDSGARHA